MKDNYGLVLGGGGAKGAYEYGALLALDELGVLSRVNMISGASIGSINMMLLMQKDLEKTKKVWENINMWDFLDIDDTGFDIFDVNDGIFSREGLRRIMDENVDFGKVSSSDMPLFIALSKRIEDDRIVPSYVKINGLDTERIKDLVIASSAIPIMYDAVNIDGSYYFDGGVSDNHPIKPVYDNGAKDIIVISNNDDYRPDTTSFADANIIPIIPSHSLELDALIGTVDFNKDNAFYRLELGYRDCLMIMQAFLDGKPVPDLKSNYVLASQALNKAKLNSRVERNMSGISDLLSKYGINDL